MAVSQSFEDKLEACINALLREEYPFTPMSIINKAAASGARSTNGDVVKTSVVLPELYLSALMMSRKRMRKKGVRAIDFMDLPAEILNRICEYAVTYSDMIYQNCGCSLYRSTEALQPAITRASRQLRHDVLPMFYGINHFVINLNLLLLGEVKFRTLGVESGWQQLGRIMRSGSRTLRSSITAFARLVPR